MYPLEEPPEYDTMATEYLDGLADEFWDWSWQAFEMTGWENAYHIPEFALTP